MAPDNPAGDDGDAGTGTVTATVTSSTATPSTFPAAGPAAVDAAVAVDSAPAAAAVVALGAAAAAAAAETSSSSAVGPTSSHPPLPLTPSSSSEPHTPTPQAFSLPPATSSGPEPAATSASSASTPTAALAAAAAAASITSTPTSDAPDLAFAVDPAPRSEPNGAGAVSQPSPADPDVEMSNHPLLLGRPAPPPTHSHQPTSSSHSTNYHRPDSHSQAPAASSAAPSAPPPSSTTPIAQFSSYSTAPTSQLPDSQRPSHANGHNSVTLPSMRTIDALAQQQHQPSQPGPHPHALNGPLQPASPPAQSYYSHAAAGATPGYGLHPELSRYPLPHDPRLPATRGSKKCDEAHPTCNNCKKSKRDCLGYDPIFRQQPAQTGIQPAPSPTASIPSSNSPGSVAGNGRQLNTYAQPSMLPAAYPSNSTPPTATASPASNSTYHSSSIAHSAASAKSEPRYEYSSSTNAAARPHQPAAFDPARHVDHTASPLDHRLPEPAPKMKIQQIIDSLGPTPTPPQVPASEETFSEITKVYHEMYASALAAFFETTWYYFAENGIMSFPKHPPLLEQMASFLKVLEAVKANDHTQMAYSGILETRIVWELACTAFQTPERGNAAMRVHLPAEGDGAEARSRLQVVDTLLCGEYLPNNPLSPPVADSDSQRTRQFDFWYNLADFIRHRDNPESPQAQQAREEVLGRMRRLLDGRENRDVLYSIAVVRHLSPNYGPSYGNSVPQHLDETDPKNRLAVASKFIMDEAQVTGGTTNVVRRISDIACRAFVNPGVNIARRA